MGSERTYSYSACLSQVDMVTEVSSYIIDEERIRNTELLFHIYFPPFCERHRWGHETRWLTSAF